MFKFALTLALAGGLVSHAFGTVTVSSPADNSTVSSPTHYVASGTTTCSKGVAARERCC